MESNKTIVIATFGLSGHEVRILQTICQLSKTLPRTYKLHNAECTQPIDIAIVDQDDAEAMATWQRIQLLNPLLPAVMLTNYPVKDSATQQLGRPIMATRLLKLLNQMQESSECPAFTTPEEVEPTQVTPNMQNTKAQWASLPAMGTLRNALVVDDSLPIRRQIELELAPLVGQIDLAENGEQALEFIAKKTYDIVFLDVVLPGMDGYKICKQIKRDRKTKTTPVIMLTGKSSPFDRVRGKLAGCDTYLTKPVDHATFESVVQKYLQREERQPLGRAGMLRLNVSEQAC